MARPMLPIVNNNNGTMSLCKNNHRVIQAKVIIRNVMYEPTKYNNRQIQQTAQQRMWQSYSKLAGLKNTGFHNTRFNITKVALSRSKS